MSNEPRAIVARLLNHLTDAVGDVASDMLDPSSGFRDEVWYKRIRRAKRHKIADLQGWLADELYNDPDTIQDMIGDRLYEECNGDNAKQLAVLNHVIGDPHYYTGLKKACLGLKKLMEGQS